MDGCDNQRHTINLRPPAPYQPERSTDMFYRIHLTGASGSGTTSLGRALAAHKTCHHFDTDDYYWLPTVPPYLAKRDPVERESLLRRALKPDSTWVLSGSLVSWGGWAIPMFDLVVWVRLEQEERMKRLIEREVYRYGKEILDTDHPWHSKHRDFLEWASKYESGTMKIRSRMMHEHWLSQLTCPVIEIWNHQSLRLTLKSLLDEMNRIAIHEPQPA